MKRLLLMLFLAAVFVVPTGAAKAQAVVQVAASKATLTNADTAFVVFNMATDDSKSIQVVVTRKTGTAAGKAILRGSNDGVNYFPAGADTLTFTNAVTNTKLWNLSPLIYAQYKVEVISSGTTTLSAKGYLLKRKT